jgi:hypothetical protein
MGYTVTQTCRSEALSAMKVHNLIFIRRRERLQDNFMVISITFRLFHILHLGLARDMPVSESFQRGGLPRRLTISSTATVTGSNLQCYKTTWPRSKVDATRDDSRWRRTSDDENQCCAHNQEASSSHACLRGKPRTATIQRGQKFPGRLRSVARIRRQHSFQEFDASCREMQIFELIQGNFPIWSSRSSSNDA